MKSKSKTNSSELVELYHESHSLVRHHLDSFNHFIDVDMRKIVEAHGRIELPTLKSFIELSNINVERPTIIEQGRSKLAVYPHQCRLRNLTYASDVTVSVTFPSNNKLITKEKVIIGRIPIMLRSNRCHLYGKSDKELMVAGECSDDPGGYFITRGTERVFMMQEQLAKNRMIIEKQKITKTGGVKVPLSERFPDPEIVCHVVSYTVESKSKTTVFRNNGYFYVQNSLFHESIPLFILFAALNMVAHLDIFLAVGPEYEMHNELICSVRESISQNIFSQTQALTWLIPRIRLASNRENRMTAVPTSQEEEELNLLMVRQELCRRVLNHVPSTPDHLLPRAQYLGMMVRRILLAERGLVALDDRDFYGIKRVELVGSYLSLAFEDKFQSLMTMLRMEMVKTHSAKKTTALEPHNMIRESFVTDGMFQCIFSGNWNLARFAMNRMGVTQVLNRLSFIATLGHLGRISSQFEKVRKISGARSIHLSQYGFVCPADTPEGEACGLMKNLAFLVEITVDLDSSQIERVIRQNYRDGVSTYRYRSSRVLIMLNGVPVGWTDDSQGFIARLRALRRRGELHEHVSIYYEKQVDTVHVCSDSGRMVRPYIIVENGRPLITMGTLSNMPGVTWKDLVAGGVIEYFDAKEGYAECLVASHEGEITQKHTHLDIDPATALGTVASLIPFPHHNQSPRNTYQCAMGKQALGIIASNQRIRCDGTQHILVTPQRPLTISNVGHLIHYDNLPAGQNAIVAITCFGGHDIEDALIINKASLERGLFRSLTNKLYTDILKDNDDLGVPAFKSFKQHALEADGTPGISEFIKNGDVVIYKLTSPEKDPLAQVDPLKPKDNGPKPSPTVYHGLGKTQCTQVILTQEEHGYSLVRVKTSQNRQPEVGDKLSSRHGQKGVIGRVVPLEEMPYTEDGLVPDIIMNPHGFPSRMTVGKLLELLANKSAVFDGVIRDSSAFTQASRGNLGDNTNHSKEDYAKVMSANGYSMSGKEVLMNGVDGRVMEADIYMGPVFYQRLKHMVQDKVHARSTGKNQPLTRQPVVGRAQDGGLRVGEMERDCLIGYGATQILRERMCLSSDAFRTYVCEKCGLLATSREWCQMCRSSQNICSVIMPYATKLLLQELMAIQIKPKLTITGHDNTIT